MRLDTLWTNARLLTVAPDAGGLGLIEHAAVGALGGRIALVAAMADLPAEIEAGNIIDCEGRLVTPGLIDCHTHLVFAGDRVAEFEQRLQGASYEAIAAAGGGILSTVRATRAADEETLVQGALPRLDTLIAEGVTTIEIKSGYGLDRDTELRMLRVARALGRRRPISVATSYLGLHAAPRDRDRDEFIADVCDVVLPAAAGEGLADAVDAFRDRIGFTEAEVTRVFRAAQTHGLAIKLHADQLTNAGGAALAARFGALSADHLEYTDDAGAAAMAAAGTVAVLLPGAFYTLREAQLPPVDAFRRHGTQMALATDCNPGSSPLTSLLLVMNMGATLFRMTVEECIRGVTRNAASALGQQDEIGTIEVGKSCDLAIWNVERAAELVYRIGFNPLHRRVWRGR
jgi:imidazolonepropionase